MSDNAVNQTCTMEFHGFVSNLSITMKLNADEKNTTIELTRYCKKKSPFGTWSQSVEDLPQSFPDLGAFEKFVRGH